jgi:hypothetical protein
MALTREQVTAVLGPVDDVLVAQIIATGASKDELTEAYAWIATEDVLMNEGRAFPTGRLGNLVRLLAEIEAEERSAWENV